MFAGFLLPLYASVHRILCADISAQILYDICNSSLWAINYLRRSLRMTSLCLACAVGRPHFHYSKGSFSFCSIDYSLLLNHSPSEWFSLYKKMHPGRATSANPGRIFLDSTSGLLDCRDAAYLLQSRQQILPDYFKGRRVILVVAVVGKRPCHQAVMRILVPAAQQCQQRRFLCACLLYTSCDQSNHFALPPLMLSSYHHRWPFFGAQKTPAQQKSEREFAQSQGFFVISIFSIF